MSKKDAKKVRSENTANGFAAMHNASHAASLVIVPMLNQALRFHQQGNLQQAASLYDNVLKIDASNFDALHLRGVVESDRGNHESAIRFIGRALSLQRASIAACQNMGIALRALKRFDEALAIYERALALEPKNHELLNNCGNVLLDLGRNSEALSLYDQALSLAPNFIDALDNRGNALREMHRFDEALACYTHAQALSPNFASAHWNEGLCRLLNGDLTEGWKKYEWGWQVGTRGRVRHFIQPLWLGQQSLQGSTILLHAEQGFGDTIQFCRYAREVSALGAHVILEVQPALKTLLNKLQGVDQIIAYGDPLPSFDCHCP
ncbi:MAG TPA: tetratricopeptide repeat protein, partial [Rhodocyclaceae bacterium]|nr:tetratricopeptide repeat protein [Rhodocyclaceae bacterium]